MAVHGSFLVQVNRTRHAGFRSGFKVFAVAEGDKASRSTADYGSRPLALIVDFTGTLLQLPGDVTLSYFNSEGNMQEITTEELTKGKKVGGTRTIGSNASRRVYAAWCLRPSNCLCVYCAPVGMPVRHLRT